MKVLKTLVIGLGILLCPCGRKVTAYGEGFIQTPSGTYLGEKRGTAYRPQRLGSQGAYRPATPTPNYNMPTYR